MKKIIFIIALTILPTLSIGTFNNHEPEQEESSWIKKVRNHQWDLLHFSLKPLLIPHNPIKELASLPVGMRILYDLSEKPDKNFLDYARIASFSIHHSSEWLSLLNETYSLNLPKDQILLVDYLSGFTYICLTTMQNFISEPAKNL